jgi:hypothetical protein
LTCNFKVTFNFEYNAPLVDIALQMFKNKMFTSKDFTRPVPLCSAPRSSTTVQEVLECYNIVGEDQEDEDLRNLQVPKTEGEHIVEGPEIEYLEYAKLLKMHKVNIGMKDNPNFANFGDCWNEGIVENIVDLRHEYQDIFPTSFS